MTIIHGFTSFNTITCCSENRALIDGDAGADKGIRANACVRADRASSLSRTSSVPTHFPGYTIIEFASVGSRMINTKALESLGKGELGEHRYTSAGFRPDTSARYPLNSQLLKFLRTSAENSAGG